MNYLPYPLEQYCTPETFDYNLLREYDILRISKRGRKTVKRDIIDCVCAFDIETTNIKRITQAVMYIWQFQFENGPTVFGRDWAEFMYFLHRLRDAMPENNVQLVIYVHNLSFEFSFLKGIYDFAVNEVFSINRRKVMKCTMFDGVFEFRCSYLQSNMNLAGFCKKFHVKHQKLKDYDYSLPRYSWDRLTVEELRYCQNDVLGLVEAIRTEMQQDGDTLVTIPYTSTGYVRRECKKAMREGLYYNYAKPFFPSPELFKLMRSAFRGGDTCANRYYCDEILHNVKSFDRSSSYPDVLCNCEFPINPFVQILEPMTEERILFLMEKRHRAFLLRVELENVRLRDISWGDPYLTKDKSEEIAGGSYFNGRVLSADKLIVAITDVDYKIIKYVYQWDKLTVLECWKSTYGPLPECFTDVVKEYYRYKTELKNVPGQEVLYMKSKNKLNSLYGMCATNPIKETIEYLAADRDFHYSEMTTDELMQECKNRYWLPYQWGIWTTALARYRLFEGIKLVTEQNKNLTNGGTFSDFVYCDTDSVKYIGDCDWTAYNEQRKADSLRSGAYATDPQGVTHYMGVYEPEHPYAEFKTIGSKKYAGIINGKLELTIAGVDKRKGSAELLAAGGLDVLEDGFIFREAGGLAALYNDMPETTEYCVKGHYIPITSNVYLEESEYTVGTLEEYKRIILMSKEDIDRIARILYNEGVLKSEQN